MDNSYWLCKRLRIAQSGFFGLASIRNSIIIISVIDFVLALSSLLFGSGRPFESNFDIFNCFTSIAIALFGLFIARLNFPDSKIACNCSRVFFYLKLY